MPRFLALNLASAALWAAIFCVIGYVFGISAERIVGAALAKHERLLIGLAIAVVATLVTWGVARSLNRRAARRV
jgi:membrane protein DedA with SNARE-associated domain